VKAFARQLRAAPGKHIWMMGGGELIASFLDAGEIDEFDIHVIPTLIGGAYRWWHRATATSPFAYARTESIPTALFDCATASQDSSGGA
jgi:dihydrofolate reductase